LGNLSTALSPLVQAERITVTIQHTLRWILEEPLILRRLCGEDATLRRMQRCVGCGRV